jgi:hypothetical protein
MNKSTTTKAPLQGGASSNMGNGGDGIVDQAKQTAANVASQAKEGVSQQINSQFDTQKEKAIEKIETVSDALRGAGEKLEGTGPLPDLAEKAAEGIDRLARFFENKSAADLVGSVERFARREPALFLGGAVALGVIAGRFLKSSGHRTSRSFIGGSELGGDYETYGYEGEYGDDFLSADDLEEDWDSEPMAFEAEDRGIGTSTGFSSGGYGASSSYGSTSDPMRTTQPQGSSVGSVGVGTSTRGGTEKMPVTQGSIGSDTDTNDISKKPGL